MLEILRLPHLVLPHIRHHDRLLQPPRSPRLPPDVMDHMRRIEVPVIRQIDDVPYRNLALAPLNLPQPLASLP